MNSRRVVYHAIADSSRLAILQAISLHIQILANCGLINVKQQGRDRFFEARLDQLSDVSGLSSTGNIGKVSWIIWKNYVVQLKKERDGKQQK